MRGAPGRPRPRPRSRAWHRVLSQKNLQLLNLNFDVTPADLVTVVATEAGLVPPSAVPVILREYRKDLHANLGNA